MPTNPLAGLILSSKVRKSDHIVAKLNDEKDALVFETSTDKNHGSLHAGM